VVDVIGMRTLALLPVAACMSSTTQVPDPVERPWATYAIPAGEHTATVDKPGLHNPIDGVTDVVGRDYELALDGSAIYVLTQPTQPEDQYDWNKLPGLSDCGTVDLAVDGAMFGWRWRIETSSLEVTAYANNDGVHLTIEAPLFTLDADDLVAAEALRYTVAREQDMYAFTVRGVVRGREIATAARLPRRCSELERDPLAWAGAFYFGGTSVAPQPITAQMRESTYEP